MKKAITLLLALCMLMGLCACGSKPAKTENTPTEKKTTTTTAPEEEKLTIQDVKRHVKAASQSDITDEETVTEGTKTTYRFKYMNGCASASVIVKDGDIQQIMSTLLFSGLTPMPDATAAEMLFFGMYAATIPAASTYLTGDTEELYRLIRGAEMESDGADNYSYTYEDNGWRYVMVVNPTFVVVSCIPLSSDTTTTTTANSTTTSHTINQQLTSAQNATAPTQNKPTATKQTTTTRKPASTQGKATSTQGKATATQNKPTSSTPTQNQDPCAHGHDWKALYKTVHYEEKGHYETVISGYNTVTSYKCAMCYEVFSSLNAYYTHFAQHEASSGSSASIFKDRYETITQKEPIYREEWVVDQEEETVEELIGYECRICGKKKN